MYVGLQHKTSSLAKYQMYLSDNIKKLKNNMKRHEDNKKFLIQRIDEEEHLQRKVKEKMKDLLFVKKLHLIFAAQKLESMSDEE
ncbi:hypothetical protein CR513_19320, partial [Mucuna pruriens]